MGKKGIAVAFLRLAASGKVREAYDKYVHPDFRHHNPYFKGDRESLLMAMEESAVKTPNKFLKIQHSFVDRNLVAIHSHVRQKDGTDISVVHIFRFEDDLIVELWDIGQLVPKESPNENGVF